MVKICVACTYVNAGGFECSECGGRLIHTSDPEAQELPDRVWKNQRVDYGARRGMIYRFLGIMLGACVGLYGVRQSVALERPWSYLLGVGSVVLGLAVWRLLHHAAHRGVRVWVLARGRVHKRRLLRAVLLGVLPSRRRRAPEPAVSEACQADACQADACPTDA